MIVVAFSKSAFNWEVLYAMIALLFCSIGRDAMNSGSVLGDCEICRINDETIQDFAISVITV